MGDIACESRVTIFLFLFFTFGILRNIFYISNVQKCCPIIGHIGYLARLFFLRYSLGFQRLNLYNINVSNQE